MFTVPQTTYRVTFAVPHVISSGVVTSVTPKLRMVTKVIQVSQYNRLKLSQGLLLVNQYNRLKLSQGLLLGVG